MLKKNIFLYATMALACFPVLPMKLGAYVIAVWFVVAVFEHFQAPSYASKKQLHWFLPTIGFFVFYALYAFVEGANSTSLHMLERKFSLLLIPMGFYLIRRPLTKKEFNLIMRTYQWACTLLALYTLAQFIPLYTANTISISSQDFNLFFRTEVENISGIHPTYISMLFLFSVFLTIHKLYKLKGKLSRLEAWVSIVQIVLLLLFCVLLTAKGPLLFFIVGTSLSFFILNRRIGIVTFATASILLLLSILFVPPVQVKFNELIKSQDESETLINSVSIRKGILNCSYALIEEHWLLGAGLKEMQNELNNCYAQYDDPIFLKASFNTHNQYFDSLISTGSLGLLLFLLMLFYPVKGLTKKEKIIFFFFKLFVLLCCLTENVLARQYGVVFFSFFNALFLKHYTEKQNTIDAKV